WNPINAGLRINGLRSTSTVGISPVGVYTDWDRRLVAGESELVLQTRHQLTPWLEVVGTANAGLLWAGRKPGEFDESSEACDPPTYDDTTQELTSGDVRCVEGYFQTDSATRPTYAEEFDPYDQEIITYDLAETGLRQNGWANVLGLGFEANADLGQRFRLSARVQAERIFAPLEEGFQVYTIDHELKARGPDAPDLERFSGQVSIAAEYRF
ncbi:MAG: hypothetical protein AAB425_12650, partial [Bdellovibrionota bacterium]